MKCIQHHTSNGTVRLPETIPTELAKELPAARSYPITKRVTKGFHEIKTYWQPTEVDIANILAGGVVVLHTYHSVLPVSRLSVEMPFPEKSDKPE